MLFSDEFIAISYSFGTWFAIAATTIAIVTQMIMTMKLPSITAVAMPAVIEL
jgi:hypothetical protein